MRREARDAVHRRAPMLVEPHHTSDWPAWAIETVAISTPQPSWLEQAAKIKQNLIEQLAPWHITEIHHVGSTAVPGLPAKPIVDLMAATARLDDAEVIAIELEHSGWHYVPPNLDQRPWRRFFVHVADGRRHAHLHLMQPSTPRWQQQLIFRDRLREDASLRAQYGELKKELARTHYEDREAYSKAKTAFITKVVTES